DHYHRVGAMTAKPPPSASAAIAEPPPCTAMAVAHTLSSSSFCRDRLLSTPLKPPLKPSSKVDAAIIFICTPSSSSRHHRPDLISHRGERHYRHHLSCIVGVGCHLLKPPSVVAGVAAAAIASCYCIVVWSYSLFFIACRLRRRRSAMVVVDYGSGRRWCKWSAMVQVIGDGGRRWCRRLGAGGRR
ncbi:hypothetical protein Dimus_024634, partial [Dionaea muscipula]